MEEVKQCTSCGEVKPLSEFNKNKTKKDGLQHECKSCMKIRNKVYYEINREKITDRVKAYRATHLAERKAYNKVYRETNREKLSACRKALRDADPDHAAWLSLKSRAKKAGLCFNLEVEDIVPPEFCPVLGLRLERGKGSGPQKTSPSVDRIDPTKGYVKGNTQVISQLANVMKQDATPEQLLMFADWIYKTYKEKQNA